MQRPSPQDLVHFASTATGSKRTFTLRPEDCSWKKIALLASVAQDALALRSEEGEAVTELRHLRPGARFVVERKAPPPKLHDWVRVCSEEEFRRRSNKLGAARLGVDGRDVLILAHRGTWHCLDAVCYHFGGPLSDGALIGDIEDLKIVCPWHRFQIDLKTGKSVQSRVEGINCLSADQMQVIHEVKVENGIIFVKLAQNCEHVASSHYALMGLYQVIPF